MLPGDGRPLGRQLRVRLDPDNPSRYNASQLRSSLNNAAVPAEAVDWENAEPTAAVRAEFALAEPAISAYEFFGKVCGV